MPASRRPYKTARYNTRDADIIDAGAVISLAVSPNEADLSSLQHMFDDATWKLYQAHTYREAMSQLSRYWVPVIVCECQLSDGSWKDFLSQMAPLADRPRLIVISKHADEGLWSEILAMDGFDLLATPLKETEVAYVVGSAWLDWRSEHEPADRHVLITAFR